jgi:chromate transporter
LIIGAADYAFFQNYRCYNAQIMLKPEQTVRHNLLDVASLFLKLGLTAFGGPAAHIAMMHDEVVTRRKWIDEQRFLDLFGAANMIPGPTSSELAIYLGFQRAGWIGLLLGGICFILPAMLIVLILAWAYVQFGATTQATQLFYGIKPVVIAIVAQALWNLGSKAIKNVLTGIIGATVIGLYLLGVNVIALLVVGGAVMLLSETIRRKNAPTIGGAFVPLVGSSLPVIAVASFSLGTLFLTFLKIGAVLYGSGYVLLAFLRADFVSGLGWLTDKQLVDAIAIGQVTPGPVFTTATFIGYLLGGVPGALMATLGIFLPSFVFVAASSPFIPRLRNSPLASKLLDGVNVASLGLMAGVTLQLAQAALIDPVTIAIAIISATLLFRFRVNSTWLIAGGAIAGLASGLWR